MIESTCKHCLKSFTPIRASAQYCCDAHRVSAHRKRKLIVPATGWQGHAPALSRISRSVNANDGTPALSNAELGAKLIEIANRDDNGEPKTGRRFYYLALSHGYIRPDMRSSEAAKRSRDAAYHRILSVLIALRMSGHLGWRDVLDLTRELVQWQTYGSPREARIAMRQNYDEDRWIGQPHFPISVVEKDTMVPVCQPMAMGWQMPFASSRGYSSLTLQHDVADMLNERYARTGQEAVVYFASDLDPSGLDLQRAWEEALASFGVRVARFVRVALTIEQVRDPALDIERLAIDVKVSDSRARRFIDQYGNRCWEADVLPASAIQEALDQDIGSWLDWKAWQRRAREIEIARSLL